MTLIAQVNYPVMKVIEGGDSLVIFTKWQADQLTKGLRSQGERLAELRTKYERLNNNHRALLLDYSDVKLNLIRTNQYNDSLIESLGTNMALLYKSSDSSEVFFVDLKYYNVDVFSKGTIFLSSMTEAQRRKLHVHLVDYPQWKYINIAWEFNSEFRSFCEPLHLYPERFLPNKIYFR